MTINASTTKQIDNAVTEAVLMLDTLSHMLIPLAQAYDLDSAKAHQWLQEVNAAGKILVALSERLQPEEAPDNVRLICIRRIDDVKVEVWSNGSGKYDLFVTDTVSRACDHRGAFNSEQAAMYEANAIICPF